LTILTREERVLEIPYSVCLVVQISKKVRHILQTIYLPPPYTNIKEDDNSSSYLRSTSRVSILH